MSIPKDADVIVIGSGAGGLGAAVSLARAGKKVLVLEQHYVPGGWCHSFYEKGFTFSPGVHYIGQLGPGQSTRELYEGLGVANELVFFRQDPQGFEQCYVDRERFDFPAGKENLIAALIDRFPNESRRIRKYLNLTDQVANEIHEIFKVDTLMDKLTVPYRTRHIGKYGLFSLRRVMDWHLDNPLLKAFLAIQCGDHGLPPSRIGYPVHAAVMEHYFNGGFYPYGGGAALPKAFIKTLKAHGGEIRTQCKVARILTENEGDRHKAIGVELDDGERLLADQIVSNADPHQTYLHMVGSDRLSKKMRKKLNRTRYSVAALNMFMVVDEDLRELGFTSGNKWYMASADTDAVFGEMMNPDLLARPTFPGFFASAPSLKDPASFNGRQHHLEAVTFIPWDSFQKFEDTEIDRRPVSYRQLKDQLSRKFLRSLELVAPGIAEKVRFSWLGTPITSTYYVNATKGNSYGTEKSFFQMGAFGFSSRSEVKNLFLCGASTKAHGVAGSTQSGVETAMTMLGCTREEIIKPDSRQQLRVYEAEDPGTWPEWVNKKIQNRRRRSGEKVTG